MSAISVQLPTDDRHCSPSIQISRIASSPRGFPCSLLSDPSLYDIPDPGPSTFRTSSPLFSYMPASTRTSLVGVLQEPRILTNFLRYVRWHDFRSLALTSAACRNVLQHPELRDAVLSAYVPGYQHCLRYADADVDPSADIDIQLNDLNDFIISQRLPLHLYPTHALATLSSLDRIPVLEKKTQKYITHCQAHSRMVLLLQALIHSSLSPVSEELEEPSLRYRSTSHQGARELVFPAPLSFISNHVESKSYGAQPTRDRVRFFSLSQTSARSRRRTSQGQLPRSISLISILGKSKVPPPPPAADPIGLKLYAGSWRGRKHAPAVSGSASEDDEVLFRQPNRGLTSTTASSHSSTDNSLGNPSPHPPRLAESLPMPQTPPHAPHDMRAATSRLRAPILRVYLPCSELDHHAIAACEEQLDDAGLWHHLSVGDVVCNLGYLPPADRLGPSTGDLTSGGKYSRESWMIFDGTGLVPYVPSAVLPLSDPLSLPSPLYYAHITRPPVNPRFTADLPREEPELSLALLPAVVPSPHSPNGVARVKKHVWLARLGPRARPGLGEGWHCEWILEGGGTKEGRQSLLDALCGEANSKREWELIMERSTTTRIWLRLVSTTPP